MERVSHEEQLCGFWGPSRGGGFVDANSDGAQSSVPRRTRHPLEDLPGSGVHASQGLVREPRTLRNSYRG